MCSIDDSEYVIDRPFEGGWAFQRTDWGEHITDDIQMFRLHSTSYALCNRTTALVYLDKGSMAHPWNGDIWRQENWHLVLFSCHLPKIEQLRAMIGAVFHRICLFGGWGHRRFSWTFSDINPLLEPIGQKWGMRKDPCPAIRIALEESPDCQAITVLLNCIQQGNPS